MTRRPLLACLLAVVLGALAAGCGRPEAKVVDLPTGQLTKQQYIDAFEVSAGGLAQRYGVDANGGGTGAAAGADRVARLQRLLRGWADRLATLHPPAEALAAHRRFIAGTRSFADDLERARRLLADGDERGAEQLLASGRIASARTRAELRAARARFHTLDYDIDKLDKTPVETR